MKRYIAILRGINVGGKRKILMHDLKELFTKLGFNNVATYIQSGNVVFTGTEEDNLALSEKIEQGILDQFGFDVPAIVRSSEEVNELVQSNPFLADADTKQLHITFLKSRPLPQDTELIENLNFLPEKLFIKSDNVFIQCAGKYSDSKLTNMFFEKKLKVPATTRNWNTVAKLATM